jgi:hypothetical protein
LLSPFLSRLDRSATLILRRSSRLI